MEEHLAIIAVGEAVGCFRRDESPLYGALPHAIVIDASAIVLNFDVNVIAAMIRAEGDSAGFRLTRGAAHVGGLDTMGDGVANKVHKGIGNLLDDVVVQLGFAAAEVEFDLFAGGSG